MIFLSQYVEELHDVTIIDQQMHMAFSRNVNSAAAAVEL